MNQQNYYPNQMQQTSFQQQPQFYANQLMHNSHSSDMMIWVLNENEATAFPVAPNNTVVLWDKNEPLIYIKSVSPQGVPAMRILRFEEQTNQPHHCQCGSKFVPIERFEEFETKFNELSAKIETMVTKPKTKKDGDE